MNRSDIYSLSMKKTFIILFTLSILGVSAITSQAYNRAALYIDPSRYNSFPASNKVNGIFVEFLADYVNGYGSLWSQELLDRGFDDNFDYCDSLKFWQKWTSNTQFQRKHWLLKEGGYNANGKYSPSIKR